MVTNGHTLYNLTNGIPNPRTACQHNLPCDLMRPRMLIDTHQVKILLELKPYVNNASWDYGVMFDATLRHEGLPDQDQDARVLALTSCAPGRVYEVPVLIRIHRVLFPPSLLYDHNRITSTLRLMQPNEQLIISRSAQPSRIQREHVHKPIP